METCIFCRTASGKEAQPEGILYHPECFSFIPEHTQAEGHRVFAPLHHISQVGQHPKALEQLSHRVGQWADQDGRRGVIGIDCLPLGPTEEHHLHVHWVPFPAMEGTDIRWGANQRCRCLVAQPSSPTSTVE